MKYDVWIENQDTGVWELPPENWNLTKAEAKAKAEEAVRDFEAYGYDGWSAVDVTKHNVPPSVEDS